MQGLRDAGVLELRDAGMLGLGEGGGGKVDSRQERREVFSVQVGTGEGVQRRRCPRSGRAIDAKRPMNSVLGPGCQIPDRERSVTSEISLLNTEH